MKTIILVLIFFINSYNSNNDTEFNYWENFSATEKECVLKAVTYQDAISLYKGTFDLGDNHQTLSLLDTLSSYDGDSLKIALYFNLFNAVCMKSDGALSEAMGSRCQRIIVNNPNYVMTYLFNNEKLLNRYIQFLGYEFYFKDKGTSMLKYNLKDFEVFLKGNLEEDLIDSQKFQFFFNEIRQTMLRMK